MRRLTRHILDLLTWRGRASYPEHAAVYGACLLLGISVAWSWGRWPVAQAGPVALALAWTAVGSTIRRAHDNNTGGLRIALVSVALAAAAVVIVVAALRGLGPAALMLLVFPAPLALAPLVFAVTPRPGANRFGETPPWTRFRHPKVVPVTDEDRTLLRRVKAGRRTALRLRPEPARVASWLGNGPALPADDPASRFICLACLDLAEARAAGGPEWLPGEGALLFLVPRDGTWANGKAALRAAAAPPPAQAKAIGYERLESFPSLDWLDAADELEGGIDGFLPFSHTSQLEEHRLGGYPCEIQDGPLALECELISKGDHRPPFEAFGDDAARKQANLAARRKWRLLLQLNADEALGWTWGDGGRLWFFVREADARRGDFSQVVVVSQTH